MNKSVRKNKTGIFLFSAIVLSVVLCSCFKKQKELNSVQIYRKGELEKFIFEVNSTFITGEGNLKQSVIKKIYYPKELELYASRVYIENGKFFNFQEKYNSSVIGVIESRGFYDPASDSGEWVEECLIRTEEERIASEIASMEEVFEEIEESDELVDDIEEIIEETSAEESETKSETEKEIIPEEIMDKSNTLHFMEYDSEILMPQKINGGWLLVHADKENVSKNIYDESYKLIKKEIWYIPSVEGAVLNQVEDYLYNKDSARPIQKNISTDQEYQEVKYNSEGLITSVEKYELFEKEKYLLLNTTREYDDKNRIILENSVEYIYKEKDKIKKLDYSFTKKHVYKYNPDEEIPPDFEYFEDGVMKMKNKYSNIKGTYTSQIFFEDDFSVKTYYEDYLKVKDVYFQNDVVTREKKYER